MKRFLLLSVLVYTVLCIVLAPLAYKGRVQELKLRYRPQTVKKAPTVLKGRIVGIQQSKQSFDFKTSEGALYKIKYKSPETMRGILDAGTLHLEVLVDAGKMPLSAPKNFKGFDYDAYLYGQGFDGRYKLLDIVGAEGRQWCLSCVRVRARATFEAAVKRWYSDETASFLSALFLGDKSDFEAFDTFKSLGLAHLFAISGLHFGLLYIGLKKIIYTGNHLVQSGIVVMFLAAFLFWVGDSYSAQRAFGIIVYYEAARIWHRKPDLFVALGFSCGLILLRAPYAVLSSAFQLSFYAYFMVAVALRAFDYKRGFLGKIKAALALQLLLWPSALYFFNEAQGHSFVVNLLFVPLMGVLLPMGILAVVLSAFSATFHVAIFEGYVTAFTTLASQVPLWPIEGVFFRHSDYYATWVALIGVLTAYAFNWTSYRIRRVTLIILCTCGLVVAGGTMSEWLSDRGYIHFVDVGHGDFVVVQFDDVVVLSDLGDGFLDVGDYLRASDVHRVSLVVLSHAHKDHHGGLEGLLEAVRVDKVLLNAETYERVAPLLAAAGTSYEIVRDSAVYQYGDLHLEIFPTFSDSQTNDNGLNTFVSLYGTSGYLLGDLHKEGMASLELKPSFQFLKVPHHGSDTSYSESFYTGSTIEIAIISSGLRYGLPDENVVSLLESVTNRVYSTYDSGEIVMTVTPRGYRIQTYLKAGG